MEHRVRPAGTDDGAGLERVYRRVRTFDWSASLRAPGTAVFVASDQRGRVLGVVQADGIDLTGPTPSSAGRRGP